MKLVMSLAGMPENVQCIKPQRKSSKLSYRIKNPHRTHSSIPAPPDKYYHPTIYSGIPAE